MLRSVLVACYMMTILLLGMRDQEASPQVPIVEPSGPQSTTQIATTVGGSTVTIRASMPDGSMVSGSGFIVDASGTIVTNSHVVQDAERVEVRLPNGDVYDVSGVRSVDRKRDLAVLQIPAFGLPPAPLGNSDSVHPGDRIVVIGNALGILENTVTAGVISGVREVEGYRLFVNVL